MLKKVAGILRQNCRPADYVARMGGDEFVLVMPDLRSRDLGPIVERIRTSIAAAAVEEYGEPLLGASIGAAELTPAISGAEELLGEADREMYRVKRQNKQQRTSPCIPFRNPAQRPSTLVQ